MKISINLLSRKRRGEDGKGVLPILGIVLMVGFVLYFLGTVIYVVFNLYQLNKKIILVNQEATDLSNEIRQKNEKVATYVLTKSILDYYENLQASKFQYKQYLDKIVSFLPFGVELKGVDFATKGWIMITVLLPDQVAVDQFEQKFRSEKETLKALFDTITVENLLRSKEGNYLIKMQFAIKKNG